VAECPIDGNRLGVPPSHSAFAMPVWLTSLGKLYRAQTPRRRLHIIEVGLLTLLVLLFLSTARFSYHSGVFQVSESPFFQIGVARSDRWIVQSGINYVPKAHLVEFPICPGYRVSIQVFF
jgi:hypothetical protein